MSLRELFKTYNAQTSLSPLLLEFEKANGAYLFNAAGEKYLDLISGISVSNWGHGNPAIINAICGQAGNYLHQMVYGEYVQKPQVKLAEKLASLLPAPLENVYFVNSGAEAVEGALKLAVRYTGRTRILAINNAYHGSTTGAMSLMSNAYYTSKVAALLNPQVDFISFNDVDAVKKINGSHACVIVEVIQGEAGYLTADRNFLEALRQQCDATGTLLIFDEIQSGMGRTGKWFAFEHYQVVPDVLLLAKALGAGMPLGAFISSRDIMISLADDPALGHMTTYGGHPVCCAAALAGIHYAEEHQVLASVEKKEKLFRELVPGDISGRGLMLALEFEEESGCKLTIEAMLQKKVISDWFLHAPQKLRIAPPLTITEDELREAAEAINSSR